FLIGNQLVLQFLDSRNWPQGAARAVVLILIMLVSVVFYLWFVNRGRRVRDGLVEGWLRGHTLLVYLFLYIPILVVVVFSFNATQRRVTQWEGFSLRWYESVLHDTVVQAALFNSFRVAIATAILATVFGTMAALALQGTPRWFRSIFEALTFISII